jgi:hypothetical protein
MVATCLPSGRFSVHRVNFAQNGGHLPTVRQVFLQSMLVLGMVYQSVFVVVQSGRRPANLPAGKGRFGRHQLRFAKLAPVLLHKMDQNNQTGLKQTALHPAQGHWLVGDGSPFVFNTINRRSCIAGGYGNMGGTGLGFKNGFCQLGAVVVFG